MPNVISTASLSETQRRQLAVLTRPPRLAIPTASLWLGQTLVVICDDTLALLGHLPLGLAMLVNTLVLYAGFSVVHDSIHRAISKNHRVNDWLGRLAIVLFTPYVSLGLFRWAHSLHHRYTGGPKDPDKEMQGPWWQLPFRWMFLDVVYLVHVLRNPDPISRRCLRDSAKLAMLTAGVLVALVFAGYGLPLLLLWFVPSRIIFLLLGFTFFWLPHLPHDTEQADNFTRATTVRLGHEWLLSPLLQYQNFHLMHHLYPTTPFFNNAKVWHLLEAELRQHDLAIQHGFALMPTIYPGHRGPEQAKLSSGG